MPENRTNAGAGMIGVPSKPFSRPVDELRGETIINQDFRKMCRRLYDGARARHSERDQPVRAIGNAVRQTQSSQLLCRSPIRSAPSGSMVGNGANGVSTALRSR